MIIIYIGLLVICHKVGSQPIFILWTFMSTVLNMLCLRVGKESGSDVLGLGVGKVSFSEEDSYANDVLRNCSQKNKTTIVRCLYGQSYPFSSSHGWMWELAEGPRTDAFELSCWRRLLRVPWTARRSSKSIKEINVDYSLKGLMLKLKFQSFGHLMWRANSLENTLMLGKTEGRRRKEQQRMKLLDSITNSVDMNLSKPWEIVEDREAWNAVVHGVAKSWTDLATEQQQQRRGWGDRNREEQADKLLQESQSR